jgi:SAM-dependent methyltransferase
MNINTLEEPIEVKACEEGAIVNESPIPGAYQQICMTLPTRKIPLRSISEDIIIYQGSADDGKGNSKEISGRTGTVLWNSGICLTRLLDQISKYDSNFLKNKTVLELGTGTGLASIAASKLGAKYVVATDGNEEVVSIATKNLQLNGVDDTKGECKKLLWNFIDAADYYDAADIVIGSDLTYNSGTWKVLAETLEAVLKPAGVCIYLTLGHTGFNVNSELGGFLTVINSGGSLEVIEKPFKDMNLEKILLDSLSKNEREVVQGTGGLRVVVLRKKVKSR